MCLWQVRQLISLYAKLLHLDACLEDMRDLGIEHESQMVLLQGQLDVMVERSMDDKVKADA